MGRGHATDRRCLNARLNVGGDKNSNQAWFLHPLMGVAAILWLTDAPLN